MFRYVYLHFGGKTVGMKLPMIPLDYKDGNQYHPERQTGFR